MMIMDNQMCVQVQGDDISPEEYHNEAGWTLAGERMSRLRQRTPASGKPNGPGGSQTSPKSKFHKNVRAAVIKAARMPAMPLEESKIVVRPRGGLDIVRTGTTTVASAILAAANIKSEESAADTICPNTQQNIMVVSTPNEDNAARYATIKEISIQGKPYEVSAYRTAPHDTVKGVIRGIPIDASADELDRNIVNVRNPLAVGAKRIGSTTTVIVAFQGPKVPNFVRYGVTLLPCHLYRKQIDVCQQCGRVGHRKDVCPTPTIMTCLACGLANPKQDHPCTPKCKLCGGEHPTGDRTCKAKYKIPYVVRKRQWERRQAERQLMSESEFPPLRQPPDARNSRTPSETRAPKSRDSSSCKRSLSRTRSPPRERVGWVDAVKGNNKRSAQKNTDATKKDDLTEVREANETLRQENVALRKTVNNLTREIAEIRKLLLCNNESLQRPTPSTSKAEETTTNNQETAVVEPALKKRAVETTRKQKEHDRIDNPEAKFEARFTKLEELITANIAAVTAMKQTMETYQAENMNKFAYIERTLQPIAVSVHGADEVTRRIIDKYLPTTPTEQHAPYGGLPNAKLDRDIDIEEVRAALHDLNSRSAAGPDLVTNKALKNLDDGSIENLAKYFNKCWRAGALPKQWKTAKTILIPKPGKPPDMDNLRPISLTSCVGKVLEYVLLNRRQRERATSPGSSNPGGERDPSINTASLRWPAAACLPRRRLLASSETEAMMIMDNQMCVQVQGDDISPEEYHNEAGWTLAGERMSRLRQRTPASGKPNGPGGSQTSPKSKFHKNVRAAVIKAARMPAMPLEESKIVVRPRGGLDIVRTGTTTVASAILAAANIKSEESAADTICPNTQQNIMVVSTPNEDNAARYATIKEISIQGKPYEVSAYRTAPHDTVKGVIRGIPIDASADELDRNIVNVRNPLAVGAKRIGSTTTVIVAFQGPKVPNFVRYGVTLLPCHLYRKQIDVCQQCGRVGHRKDVCPTPTIMTCLACGLANPKQDHPCTPKCKLCGGEHPTGDRTCKAKYKIPYVVRKRQWERRQAERQLMSESEFPPLGQPPDARNSRTPSETRAPKSRDSSSCKRSLSRTRSPPRERVGWVDAVKGNNKRSAQKNTDATKKDDLTEVREANETLRQENVALRKTVNNLTREIAEIRKLLLCNNESLQRPTPSTSKAEETTTNNQETAVVEPALKKRAVETTRKQKEHDRIDNPEAKFEARFTKLEELITANIAAVTAMKQTMETYQAENMNKFAYIERTLQPIAVSVHGADEVTRRIIDKYLPTTPTEQHAPYGGLPNAKLDRDIDIEEVRAALHDLNSRSAAGPDLVTNKALKNLDDGSIENLAKYFNKCWRAGALPKQWKTAKTILIPKPGKPPDMDNLRPISLTSCVGKVLEYVLLNRWRGGSSKMAEETGIDSPGFPVRLFADAAKTRVADVGDGKRKPPGVRVKPYARHHGQLKVPNDSPNDDELY
ncbi:hypothetical protein ISCGN_008520 [Ixodes scapularis]